MKRWVDESAVAMPVGNLSTLYVKTSSLGGEVKTDAEGLTVNLQV